MDFPSRVLDSVGDIRAAAQEQAKALKAEADEAARIERVWDDLFRFVSRGWLFHVVNLLEKESPLLKKMWAESHPASPILEEAYRIAALITASATFGHSE